MRALKIVAVTAATLLLAGCTGGDAKNDYGTGSPYKFKIASQHRGLPKQLKNDQFNASPAVYWSNKAKRTVTLVAYGSSSCPTVPTDLVLNGARNFRLPLKEYSGACTADLGPHVSVFTVPAKVSRTKAVTVTLDAKNAAASDTQLTLAPASILSELGN